MMLVLVWDQKNVGCTLQNSYDRSINFCDFLSYILTPWDPEIWLEAAGNGDARKTLLVFRRGGGAS